MAEDAPLRGGRYDHDVFISYAHEDGDWVHTKLVPRLEGARLRVHTDEKFRVGGYATANMQRAVARSRYTLLVLSPDWVKSSYTEYETRLAVEKSLREKSRSVLPLMLRPCDDLPDDIRALTWASFVEEKRFENEVLRLLEAITSECVSEADEQATAVFATLDDIFEDRDVRSAFSDFRSAVGETSPSLLKLHDLKELHDLLHQLQELHKPIALLIGQLATVGVLDMFVVYADKIRGIAAGARMVSRRDTVAGERFEWIDDIEHAQVRLRDGASAVDQAAVVESMWTINLVLGSQPSVINRGLVDCAKNVRLRELRGAFEYVCRKARELKMPAEKVDRLTAAAAALEELHRVVSDLVDDHDFWQITETQLRMVEAELPLGVEGLRHVWPMVKRKLSRVRQGEVWADEMVASRDGLEVAIMEKNDTMARRTFLVLRSQAERRFTHVDTQLKERCGQLRSLGEKLAFISEIAQ